MKIAICDDMREQLSDIREKLNVYLSANQITAIVSEFTSPTDLLDSYMKNCFDIILLDICMPQMSGIEMSVQIRKSEQLKNHQTQIVFFTTSNEFAIDAFSLHAAHYILKPFTQAQFDDAINRAIQLCVCDIDQFFAVKTANGKVVKIDIKDILYIDSYTHEQMLHLKTGETLTLRQSLAGIFESLNRIKNGCFIQPYKGYIVNMGCIARIEPKYILLNNEERIPIVQRNFHKIKESYFKYIFGR